VAAGLKHMAGNQDLYLRLLTRFHDDYAHTPAKLRELIGANSRDEAQRLAHTAKSLAANLGANRLANAARLLELALKSGDTTDTEGMLDDFSQENQDVLDELRQVMQPPADSAPATPSSIDKAAALAIIQTLDQTLDEDFIAAVALFNKLRDDLAGSASAPVLSRLGKCLDAFDTIGARHELTALANHLHTLEEETPA